MIQNFWPAIKTEFIEQQSAVFVLTIEKQ
jgi:hypothetical protein